MKKYGIQVEESHTYIYRGFRYRNLSDAINYAILKEEKQKADSADDPQMPERGDSNVISER